jgi:DNA invertase Pin-like site-specific DNA recombinase
VGLVSLKDGLDLSTPAGRLMANMLALEVCGSNAALV